MLLMDLILKGYNVHDIPSMEDIFRAHLADISHTAVAIWDAYTQYLGPYETLPEEVADIYEQELINVICKNFNIPGYDRSIVNDLLWFMWSITPNISSRRREREERIDKEIGGLVEVAPMTNPTGMIFKLEIPVNPTEVIEALQKNKEEETEE